MLRSLRHISTDSTGWTKKLEKTPDETYVFLWIIVHIINVDISYYVLGKRAEWDRNRERERDSDTICLWSGGIPQKVFPTFFMFTWWRECKNVQETWFSRWLSEGRQRQGKKCCRMGWIGCAILQVDQKATVEIRFLATSSSSRYLWKTLSNVGKTFCCISPL